MPRLAFLVSILVLAASACGDDAPSSPADAGTNAAPDAAPCSLGIPTWSAVPSSPLSDLAYSPYTLRNDPSVMREGDELRMWLSGGDPRSGANPVSLYQARSIDGVDWTIEPTPILEPGTSGQWDDHAVETPSVARDGAGIYHLYYTGSNVGAAPGVYSIGHATSSDGSSWTKDPANPVITTAATSDWGIFTVAEPAAVYVPETGEIRLYYASAHTTDGAFGILLATSTDGSSFEHREDADGNREPVLVQSASYPANEGYRGYSTPAVAIGPEGRFHLFHDVVTGDFEQVAIAYAVSDDGITFSEVQTDIVTRDSASWLEREVRAPFPFFEADKLVLYFVGGIALGNWDTHVEGMAAIEAALTCPSPSRWPPDPPAPGHYRRLIG